jgi:hypothetical protein
LAHVSIKKPADLVLISVLKVELFPKLFMDRFGRFWNLILAEDVKIGLKEEKRGDDQWFMKFKDMGYRSYLLCGTKRSNDPMEWVVIKS